MKRFTLLFVIFLILTGVAAAEKAGAAQTSPAILEPQENGMVYPDHQGMYTFQIMLPPGGRAMVDITDVAISETVYSIEMSSDTGEDILYLGVEESDLAPKRQYEFRVSSEGKTQSVLFTTADPSVPRTQFIDRPHENGTLAPDRYGSYVFDLTLPPHEPISCTVTDMVTGEPVYTEEDPPAPVDYYYPLSVDVEETKLVPGRQYQFSVTAGGTTCSVLFTAAGATATHAERLSSIVQSIREDSIIGRPDTPKEGLMVLEGVAYNYTGSYDSKNEKGRIIPNSKIRYVSATRPLIDNESVQHGYSVMLMILNGGEIADTQNHRFMIYGFCPLNEQTGLLLFATLNDHGSTEQYVYVQDISANDDSTYTVQSYICSDLLTVEGITGAMQALSESGEKLYVPEAGAQGKPDVRQTAEIPAENRTDAPHSTAAIAENRTDAPENTEADSGDRADAPENTGAVFENRTDGDKTAESPAITEEERLSGMLQRIRNELADGRLDTQLDDTVTLKEGNRFHFDGFCASRHETVIPESQIRFKSGPHPVTDYDSARFCLQLMVSLLHVERCLDLQSIKDMKDLGYHRLDEHTDILLFAADTGRGWEFYVCFREIIPSDDVSESSMKCQISANPEIAASFAESPLFEKTSGTGQFPAGLTGKCTASKVNVRRQPAMNAGSLGQINRGDRITVLENQGEWSRISCSRGEGYIKTQYIQLDAK